MDNFPKLRTKFFVTSCLTEKNIDASSGETIETNYKLNLSFYHSVKEKEYSLSFWRSYLKVVHVKNLENQRGYCNYKILLTKNKRTFILTDSKEEIAYKLNNKILELKSLKSFPLRLFSVRRD